MAALGRSVTPLNGLEGAVYRYNAVSGCYVRFRHGRDPVGNILH